MVVTYHHIKFHMPSSSSHHLTQGSSTFMVTVTTNIVVWLTGHTWKTTVSGTSNHPNWCVIFYSI